MKTTWTRNLWALSWVACAAMACGGGGGGGDPVAVDGADLGSGESPGGTSAAGGFGGGAEGPVEHAVTSVAFADAPSGLKVGESADLILRAHLDDDSEVDVTAEAEFTTSDSLVLTVDGARVTAVAAGSAEVRAAYKGKTSSQTIDVAMPVVSGIALSPQLMEFKRGEPEQLTVTATYDNGETTEVTTGVRWESSNPDVATVDEHGLVTPLRGGPVTISARWDDQSASLDATTTCQYPRFARALVYDATMPPLFWEGAYQADGSKFDFRLEDVYCDVAHKDVKVIFFMISAGWCTPCTIYAQRLMPDIGFIEEAGGRMVIVEAETEDFAPADNDYAQRHIEHIIGDAYAIRLGDLDTQPYSNFLRSQSLVVAFPTIIAVRTSDMHVITDSNHSQYYLPLLQIAQDPEADWSNPGPPPFNNHCGASDDEPSDIANNMAEGAVPLAVGSQHGGICNESPDFYKIEVDGEWKLELDFDHNVGDLDVFVWDPVQMQGLSENGTPVGSAGVKSHEEFVYHGPQTIVVTGYQGASAPYDLKLTPQ